MNMKAIGNYLPAVVKNQAGAQVNSAGKQLPALIKKELPDIVEFSAKKTNVLKKAGIIGVIAAAITAAGAALSNKNNDKVQASE